MSNLKYNVVTKADRIADIHAANMLMATYVTLYSQTAHLLDLSMVMSVLCIMEFAASILMS